MTFSLLVRDPETGEMGGAAATGSLCVGGWVLRGDARAGMSASQGASPSTFWGEDVLALMREGQGAATAVKAVVAPDQGRDWRQLAALDRDGGTGSHTGSRNGAARGALAFEGGVASGNLLASEAVLDALRDGYLGASGGMAERLMAGLRAAEAAGSDSRGLQSAALLIVSPEMAPLTLRVDYAEAPLDALEALLERASSGSYAEWKVQVPVLEDPTRVLSDPEA